MCDVVLRVREWKREWTFEEGSVIQGKEVVMDEGMLSHGIRQPQEERRRLLWEFPE